MQKIKAIIFDPRAPIAVYLLLAVLVTIQLISLGTHRFVMPHVLNSGSGDIMNDTLVLKRYLGTRHTDYNNYIVFRQSWFHLWRGQNLYSIYPVEQWDLYKYSPTFAVFMGAFTYLPDAAGLCLWTLLNVLALCAGVRMLPLSARHQAALLWFLTFEMLTSIQNAQSNCLLCGLIVLAYGCMQQRKVLLATLWIALATYIKVYGAIGFCLFLFYPQKGKFVLYSALWMMFLAALPLLVTPLHTLVWQYHNWIDLLRADATAATGLSVAGWLESWFGLENVKPVVTVAGVLLFFLPFVRTRLYTDENYKLLILAFALVWMVIFNHKAESPTYIIAVTGAGIWYFSQPRTVWHRVLIWVLFVFTCLSPTDLFPLYIRGHFLVPYTVKAVPCIVVWSVMLVELMRIKKGLGGAGHIATGS